MSGHAGGDESAMPGEGAGPSRAGDDESAMPSRPTAVRLTFTYDGDDVQLVSRQQVEVVVPPADSSAGEPQLGAWVEVRGSQEQTLYRRVLPDPFRQDVEVFSPGPGESVSRAPVDVAAGSFSVVVPQLDEAEYVALLSSARPGRLAERGAAAEDEAAPAAVEVARFSLRPQGGAR